jgi:hypothetical protein
MIKLIEQKARQMNTKTFTASLTEKYSGGHYDRLTDESKYLTALAWDQYPSQAFENLVAKVAELNKEWADLISNEGINYFVIAEGDLFCASGFVSNEKIDCNTEEWYAEIGKSKFSNKSDNYEEEWEELQNLIEEFRFAICEEVERLVG